MVIQKKDTMKDYNSWVELTHKLGKDFESRAAKHDDEGEFVFENYKQLKEHKFFSASIPKQLGGGELTHEEMCNIIRIIAYYCSSTALAFSMHQHIISTTLWKYKHQQAGEPLLKKVAKNQLVLISTGARDWLDSNGDMKKVEGGYLVNAKKHFSSQSAGGDVAIATARYQNEQGDWKVLHFPVPMNADGVSVLNDWNVMGMRATGSQTIVFKDVFVPESAIGLERPMDEFHPVWSVVLTVALPLIMSAYVGIAEKAAEIAISKGKQYKRNAKHMKYILGKLNNELLSAQAQWQAMIGLANNYEFKPNEANTMKTLSYKTNVSEATKNTVAEAMEAIGGQSFLKEYNLERLFRDVQASPFHPLGKWDQYAFVGERLMQEE